MRQGELLSLTWDRVDLKRGWIQLPGELTKSGESRPVALNEVAADALRFFLYRASGKIGPVFSLPDGRRVKKDTLHYNYTRTRALAGITDFRWHDWRATFIAMARRASRRHRDLMKQVGHKTDSMPRRYDRVSAEDLQELVSGLKMESMTEAETPTEKVVSKVALKNQGVPSMAYK